MAKKGKAYFGLGWIISLILAIIPITNWICGMITRLQRGKILGFVLNLIFSFVFWIIDLISIIIRGDLFVLA